MAAPIPTSQMNEGNAVLPWKSGQVLDEMVAGLMRGLTIGKDWEIHLCYPSSIWNFLESFLEAMFCFPYKHLNTALYDRIERKMTVNNSVQAFHLSSQD